MPKYNIEDIEPWGLQLDVKFTISKGECMGFTIIRRDGVGVKVIDDDIVGYVNPKNYHSDDLEKSGPRYVVIVDYDDIASFESLDDAEEYTINFIAEIKGEIEETQIIIVKQNPEEEEEEEEEDDGFCFCYGNPTDKYDEHNTEVRSYVGYDEELFVEEHCGSGHPYSNEVQMEIKQQRREYEDDSDDSDEY